MPRRNTPEHSYFDSVSTQLELSVGRSCAGVVSNVESNAASGVSPGLNAVDTGLKAGMALQGVVEQSLESAYLPALAQLGLKGMACLPVSKQLDPVLGIDCHVMVPGGPLPNPYIGLLINPKDFIAVALASRLPPPPAPPSDAQSGEGDSSKLMELAHTAATMVISMTGATVKIGSFIPRAVAGTPTRNVFHFPIGGSFVVPPRNVGHAFMGSLNVLADGEPLSGGGAHLHMDCWDIGLPTPHIIKGGSEYFALFMPTGVIIPIPPARPILTNPIPTPLNPIAALKRKLMGSLGRFYRKKMKRLAEKLHTINIKIGSERLQNLWHKAVCTVTGHPVDVSSGLFFTDEEDFFLTGVIPISWERTWYSKSDYEGPLGNGWHHAYDMGLVVDEQNITLRLSDGRPIALSHPDEAEATLDVKERVELRIDSDGRYTLYQIDEDLYYHFTEESYDEVHLLERISDSNGFSIRLSYTAEGRLKEITDTAERKLRFEHDNKGRILAVYAPDPEYWLHQEICIARYRYDEEGNLLEETNAVGDSIRYAYEGRLLTHEVWRNGIEWFFEYDGREIGARCIHTWGSQNIYNHKLRFFKGYTEVLDSYDKKTTYYHKDGLVYLRIDPNGAEWRTQHNDEGQVTAEIDPQGNSYLYSYDALGNRISNADPEGGNIELTYYKSRELRYRPLAVRTLDGGSWSFAYDRQGNVIERSNPKGAKTTLSYKDGLVEEVTDSFGVVTKLSYDRWHNVCEAADSRGNVTRYSYDGLGRCIEVINAKGARQRRRYDLVGRIIGVDDFDGNHIKLSYDGIDNLVHYQDDHQEVEYGYEGMWKLVRRRDHRGVINFFHDCEERLKEVRNENWESYDFTLDAAGYVIAESGFDGATRYYERDSAGRVLKETLPSGKFKRYGYDKCGRVTEITHDYDQVEKHSYSYWTSGRIREAVNEHARVSFRYDGMGLPVEERCDEHLIKRSYDKHGLIRSLQSSLGAQLSYERNEYGELICFKANEAETNARFTSEHRYDSLGFELERLLPGGVSQSFAYDNIGRLVNSKTRRSAEQRRSRHYNRGSADRLLSIEDDRYGLTQYSYSPSGELTMATYADGTKEYRLSDKVGNLYNDPDKKLRKYLEGGRIEKSGEWTFKYDKDGQLIEKFRGKAGFFSAKKDRWEYSWNQNGTLKGVFAPHRHGHWTRFTYDALGRRLTKLGDVTFHYLWNGNVPLHEWQTGNRYVGSVLTPYSEDFKTWLFEEESFVPLALIQEGKAYSIVCDQLGTPTEAYDEEGKEVWYRRLDMNGKVIEETQPGLNPEGYVSIPFLFQGQYYDYETGLAYNRFRYYDPELGRYISEDPIRFASGTLALHSYVEDTNDWTDESGLSKYYGMLKDKSRKKRKPGRKKKRGRKPKKKTTGEANLQLLATSKRGRNAHRNYRNTLPSSYEFEVVLDNGRRVDAINFDEKIVRELKPDTPSGIAKGNSQLAEYVTQLEEQTGDTWTGFLDTYTP